MNSYNASGDSGLERFMNITQGNPEKMRAFAKALQHTMATFRSRCFSALEKGSESELTASFHFIRPTCILFELQEINGLISKIIETDKPIRAKDLLKLKNTYDNYVADLLKKVEFATEAASAR